MVKRRGKYARVPPRRHVKYHARSRFGIRLALFLCMGTMRTPKQGTRDARPAIGLARDVHFQRWASSPTHDRN